MAASLSVRETVDRILSSVDSTPVVKTAACAPLAPDTRHPLKKLASALRALPAPQLTYAVLHVVKTAMIDGTLGPLEPPPVPTFEGATASTSLHKLAHALRIEDNEDHERLLAHGAHTLRAARGLTLLRELTRE